MSNSRATSLGHGMLRQCQKDGAVGQLARAIEEPLPGLAADEAIDELRLECRDGTSEEAKRWIIIKLKYSPLERKRLIPEVAQLRVLRGIKDARDDYFEGALKLSILKLFKKGRFDLNFNKVRFKIYYYDTKKSLATMKQIAKKNKNTTLLQQIEDKTNHDYLQVETTEGYVIRQENSEYQQIIINFDTIFPLVSSQQDRVLRKKKRDDDDQPAKLPDEPKKGPEQSSILSALGQPVVSKVGEQMVEKPKIVTYFLIQCEFAEKMEFYELEAEQPFQLEVSIRR